MTKQQKRARMSEIVNKLKEVYPEAVCALEWNGELLAGLLQDNSDQNHCNRQKQATDNILCYHTKPPIFLHFIPENPDILHTIPVHYIISVCKMQ